jgi:UDP-GlcNAc:undecaprenyl-phosphate GlcNAc-1-phosphate transferase
MLDISSGGYISSGGFSSIIVFTLSLLISTAIIALGLVGQLTIPEQSRSASVQNIHRRTAPRTGGVSIFASIACALAFVPSAMEMWYGSLLFASSIVFIVGFAEDIGLNISPRNRLAAALASGLGSVLLLGEWLPRTDLVLIDHYIEFWWIGVPATVIITAGFANAFNMVDGLHGLALGITAIATASLVAIAQQTGDVAVQNLALMLLMSIFGLLVFNFPWGLIFLGDAGAYTLGFVVSWLGVVLLINSSSLSFWSIILIVMLPSCDMLLSIYRRLSCKRATFRADRMHLHHVVFRAMRVTLSKTALRDYANPLSTVVLMPFAIVPALFGVQFWNNPTVSFFAALAFALLYVVSYLSLIKLIKLRKIPLL